MKEIVKICNAHGVGQAVVLLQEALADEGQHRLRAEEFSLKQLWEAFNGPVERSLTSTGSGFTQLQEAAVGSSSFADITGVLLASKVIEGYNAPGFIGKSLVTNIPSSRKNETYAGFGVPDVPVEVAEGMPYPQTGFGDKFVTSSALKKGRLLDITMEAIMFDQTGQLLMRAGNIGEKMRLEQERVILRGITDADSVVFKPQGVAEALYRTAAGTNSDTINKITSNALVDWTDIDAVMQVFAGMRDENGDEIVAFPNTLLTANALSATANRILTATKLEHTASGSTYTTTSGNPISGIRPQSSLLLDSISTTNWYLGDFPKQFGWQEVLPMQVMRKRLESDAHTRDIVTSYKVRYFGGMLALDDKYVVQSTT